MSKAEKFLSPTRVFLTATCGHVLEPHPACDEEAYLPSAYCSLCDDALVSFPGAWYDYRPQGWTLRLIS